MSSPWIRFTIALIAAIMALSARPALAATAAEQSEALIRQGVQLRAQDKTAEALEIFEKAYRIAPSPRAAGQLGLCELELGKYVAAERHLTEALAIPEHPWIAKNKATLKRQLDTAAANIGELSLAVSPAQAEVSLGGKPVERAALSAPIRLAKGSVDLEIREAGYQPVSETITILGGKREQRTFVLVPEAPVPVAAEPTSQAPLAGAIEAGTTQPAGPASGTAGRARIAAWVTGGVAVAALVLGTAEAFNAASKRDAFNDHTGTMNGVAFEDCGTAALNPACKSIKDAHDQALTLSIVGFAAAGALAATSAVLFTLSSSGHPGNLEDSGPARALTCVPDLGARGFGCVLRF
jgi:hypothetical protein